MSSEPTTAASPRLYGARARAGMQALADRLGTSQRSVRVFGHPVLAPADRDALVAAFAAAFACLMSWIAPSIALFTGIITVLFCAAVGFAWLSPWPRAGGWTIVVGRPSPAIRRVVVLALDVREPRRWITAVAGFLAGLSAAIPGWPGPLLLALGVVGVAAFDRVRAREMPIERAEAWVLARPASTDTLILVSTAGSGHGEGVRATLDWFALDGRNLAVEIDEERVGATVRRLNAIGIGRPAVQGGADAVAGDRARG